MKDVINEAMKQDFSATVVQGRVLFGISFLALGVYSILNAKMWASWAPSFVPDMLSPLLVVLVGCVFAGAGFGIATNKAVARNATAIALVWLSMAIFANIFSQYFDVREFFVAIAMVGASLVIKAQAEIPETVIMSRPVDPVEPPLHMQDQM
ncbi:MAG: drug/metabolite transporter (DMT)-like permease [Patiriisocius sp.]|jgi:drug/metabolite transporter (DMT)-like permease